MNSSLVGNNNASYSLTSQKAFFLQYYPNFISYIIVGGLICLFAVLSNGACFIAICTYPSLKRQGNILVANLVLVNILLGLTVHPVTLISVLYRQYHNLPPFFCDWLVYFYFLIHSFIWHECLLSINRFIAIIFPHRYKTISTKFALILTLVVGYVIAFVINAYPVWLMGDKQHVYVSSLPFGSCRFNPGHQSVYPVVQVVLGSHLPLCVIGTSYVTLFGLSWWKTRRYDGKRPGHFTPITGSKKAGLSKRTRLARMLFCSFLWNLIVYLPQPILTSLVLDFNSRYPTAFFYVRWVSQLGVAGNAVVYALLHRDYRRGMLAVLQCTRARLRSPLQSDTVLHATTQPPSHTCLHSNHKPLLRLTRLSIRDITAVNFQRSPSGDW